MNPNAKKLVEALDKSHGLLVEFIDAGPYCSDDGECSFCAFIPNDCDELDHVVAHEEKCLWRRGTAQIAAIIRSEPDGLFAK